MMIRYLIIGFILSAILYVNAAKCPKHEEMHNCGSLCEPRCDNQNPDCGQGPGVPPSCGTGPMRNCRCKDGFFRNGKGKCVKAKKC